MEHALIASRPRLAFEEGNQEEENHVSPGKRLLVPDLLYNCGAAPSAPAIARIRRLLVAINARTAERSPIAFSHLFFTAVCASFQNACRTIAITTAFTA